MMVRIGETARARQAILAALLALARKAKPSSAS
jgi:hypothetical protein